MHKYHIIHVENTGAKVVNEFDLNNTKEKYKHIRSFFADNVKTAKKVFENYQNYICNGI